MRKEINHERDEKYERYEKYERDTKWIQKKEAIF